MPEIKDHEIQQALIKLIELARNKNIPTVVCLDEGMPEVSGCADEMTMQFFTAAWGLNRAEIRLGISSSVAKGGRKKLIEILTDEEELNKAV